MDSMSLIKHVDEWLEEVPGGKLEGISQRGPQTAMSYKYESEEKEADGLRNEVCGMNNYLGRVGSWLMLVIQAFVVGHRM